LAIAYIGVGSNLKNPKNNIQKAIKMIEEEKILEEIEASSLYLTEPIGKKEQPDFLNLVIKGQTELTPFELLESLLKIEEDLGRKRREKWGPREIDLDILFYDDLIINQKGLVIPHPQIGNRKFVLVPLAEVSPNLEHPALKKNIKKLLEDTKDQSKIELYGGIYAGE
jgi:2-amino-4-hydroxy-6-hydroxymethyldihydropteridine diphosphokinase